MELNREKIVKALEICSDETTEHCTGCPFIENGGCKQSSMLKLALALIRELTEECKKWQSRLEIECDYTKADTVRKMQEMLKECFCCDSENIRNTDAYVRDVVEQIAKEMLEEE